MNFAIVEKKNIIPPGYQLHIDTWENDGDNGSTQIISGLTEEDTRFYVELCHKFKSASNGGKELGYFGNHGCEEAELKAAVKEVMLNHFGKISDKTRMTFAVALNDQDCNHECDDCELEDCSAEGLHYLLCETMLGFTSEYYDERNFCRVFENFKVFYIPEAAEDVTSKFRLPVVKKTRRLP